MFSAFVDVFFVPVLEVDYGVVSDLADEGVVMDGILVEKFFRQTVYTRSVNKVMRLAAYRTIWQNCGLALHMKVR